MELTLHSLGKNCRVTGREFVEGERVVSFLVREANNEIARHDLLATEVERYERPAFVFCSWTLAYKAKRTEENPDRAMKLTAENLFVTLADPLAEPNDENTPLLQFLALMLERKKVLKPRGLNADKTKQVYEHAKTRLTYEIPAGVLDEAFFVKIQGQLDLLVGGPKKKAAEAKSEPEAPVQTNAEAAMEEPKKEEEAKVEGEKVEPQAGEAVEKQEGAG